MKSKYLNYSLLIIVISLLSFTNINQEDDWKRLIEREAKLAAEQYKILYAKTPKDRMPKTYYSDKNEWETSSTSWWTSGFFPGTLFYLYELTGEQELLDLGMDKLEILEKEKHNKGTHDLGFMLYCSFGHAERLRPNERFKQIMLTGAESLSSRFNESAGVIRSWDHGNWKFPVIIDNMMNLEFLFWASEYSGNSKFRDLSITHADNTIKNHFRDDFSSYHVIDYDPRTGEVIGKETAQGLHDNSSWARGQSWALYGYTVMYRLTKDEKYLEQAIGIADFIFNHPNLPEDLIPYWDFDITEEEQMHRDVSAAAINASALLELAKYSSEKRSADFVKKAELILKNLVSDQYRAKGDEEGGFLLKYSVGHFKANSEVDVPLTYADYYFVEALVRYRDWYLN
ncbi:Glucuronyl hydrolase [Indibacter alkaliphilus LW1]|uniref:Glucuronyl hydrolase n=1 Tax=Indibacter alkaliphilus (strain CCUG 57479 / KCTC 22604 / LW1) TaxID=1189612 RepID=S2DFC4_INDAL|nr:glycoside hydrolase family 88 protein [Indibacter alkaliphilus]EOZ97817.1 Glucuronyl hydrolase [Indibacter alkaliphilus LW1]